MRLFGMICDDNSAMFSANELRVDAHKRKLPQPKFLYYGDVFLSHMLRDFREEIEHWDRVTAPWMRHNGKPVGYSCGMEWRYVPSILGNCYWVTDEEPEEGQQ